MKYRVTFTCYYEYEVEAEDENEAEDIGECLPDHS